MSRASRLGLAGVGACVLGLIMTVWAAGVYPHPAGSNINFDRDILFAVVFFTGEVIGLIGLGVLIILGIYRRQNSNETRKTSLAFRVGGCSQP